MPGETLQVSHGVVDSIDPAIDYVVSHFHRSPASITDPDGTITRVSAAPSGGMPDPGRTEHVDGSLVGHMAWGRGVTEQPGPYS